jgi:hypothetical protein
MWITWLKFGRELRFEWPRIGNESTPMGYPRPRAYLLLSSQDVPPGTSAPSSATHMGGFHGLMVAASIRLRLLDKSDH